MTTIKALCPRCHDEVALAPEELVLRLSPEPAAYSFVCPRCSRGVEKRADEKIVALLLAAGVTPVERPDLGGPDLAPSVRAAVGLPAFTEYDVATLVSQMADEAFFDQFR